MNHSFPFVLLLTLSFAACDRSITTSGSMDPRVTNGTAFDHATLDISCIDTLIVPDSAAITTDAPSARLDIHIKKILAFGGHPPSPISIHDQRRTMSCAQKRDGTTLTIATIGEWDSHIEGGAHMDLSLSVPPTLKVLRQRNLTGDASPAENHAAKPFYWQPGPLTPGWTPIPDLPDATLR